MVINGSGAKISNRQGTDSPKLSSSKHGGVEVGLSNAYDLALSSLISSLNLFPGLIKGILWCSANTSSCFLLSPYGKLMLRTFVLCSVVLGNNSRKVIPSRDSSSNRSQVRRCLPALTGLLCLRRTNR